MKKLLALLLALTCIFSVVSCAGNNNDGGNGGEVELTTAELLELYNGYLAASAPTKSEVTSTTTESNNVLVSTSVLTSGKVGEKAASKLVSNTQTFSAIENGMLNLINESKAEEWFLEGKGTSSGTPQQVGRRWDSEGTNFAPVQGSLQIGLAEENFTSVTYDKAKGELVLVCAEGKAASVIGYYLPGDYDHTYATTVTLTAFGDKITGIKISYAIDDREIGDDIDSSVYIEYTTVEIDAVYSYGLQTIDFNGYKG